MACFAFQLVGLNIRDRTVFDLYRVDLTTGAVVLDTENDGTITFWHTDYNFQVRWGTLVDLVAHLGHVKQMDAPSLMKANIRRRHSHDRLD